MLEVTIITTSYLGLAYNNCQNATCMSAALQNKPDGCSVWAIYRVGAIYKNHGTKYYLTLEFFLM